MTSTVIISHVAMLDDLTTLIRSNPDPRELKRAIAVQMWNKGHKHQEIQDSLSVSSGFISKWTQRYEREGVLSLKLAHRGSTGYLDPEQRSKVIQWIQAKDAWHLSELEIQRRRSIRCAGHAWRAKDRPSAPLAIAGRPGNTIGGDQDQPGDGWTSSGAGRRQ